MADFLLTPVFIWLGLVVIFLIAEMITVGLVSIWFAGGAFAALLLAVMGLSESMQILVFFVVSFALVLFTRPFARRYVKPHNIKTNYEDIIGKEVLVTIRIDNRAGTGTAVCNGLEWSARSVDDNMVIEAGEMAYVSEIRGVKLIVKRNVTQSKET